MSDTALSPKKFGVAVYCTVCGAMKNPIGRDGGYWGNYCSMECPGYNKPPYAGSLWPGESEEEFGYPAGMSGVEVRS